MYRIGTIFGTRPEIIKLSSVIEKFDKHTEQVLINTNQNFSYELNEIFFADLGMRKADYNLNVMGDTPCQTIANTIQQTDQLISDINLDAILVYGDTNSAFSAIAAKKHKIPIFHMEAGNRSFDMRVPEEFNRTIIDNTADINIVLSEQAQQNLIGEGFPRRQIFNVGSHLPEVYDRHWDKISASLVLRKLGLQKEGYVLASFHREENVDDAEKLTGILLELEDIGREFNLPVVISTHFRTRKNLNSLRGINFSENMKFIDPFCFSDYIRLSLDSKCIISDSGSAPEEAAILKTNTVVVREAHERPETIETGFFILSGLKRGAIHNAFKIATTNDAKDAAVVDVYRNKHVSNAILNIVLSNIDYVNENIWKKDRELLD